MEDSPLVVQGWKSCQVIFHHKTDIALCNRSECPLFKRKRCSDCDHRVLFHDKTDRKIVKLSLSLAGLFFTDYIKTARGAQPFMQSVFSRAVKLVDLTKRVDIGTRTFMYKILLNLSVKDSEGIMTVETFDSHDEFASSLAILASVFLDVAPKKIGYIPRIIEN